MDFAFGDEQLEFRTQLRALTDKSCTPADIREAWASERGWSPQRWASLAEMGVVGLTVPEADGGLGLGLVDLVLLLEEYVVALPTTEGPDELEPIGVAAAMVNDCCT